jgi:hypothetical protein
MTTNLVANLVKTEDGSHHWFQFETILACKDHNFNTPDMYFQDSKGLYQYLVFRYFSFEIHQEFTTRQRLHRRESTELPENPQSKSHLK